MLLSRFLFAMFAVSSGMFIFVATVLRNLTKIKGSITMLKMKTLTKCYGSFKVKMKDLNKFELQFETTFKIRLPPCDLDWQKDTINFIVTISGQLVELSKEAKS